MPPVKAPEKAVVTHDGFVLAASANVPMLVAKKALAAGVGGESPHVFDTGIRNISLYTLAKAFRAIVRHGSVV